MSVYSLQESEAGGDAPVGITLAPGEDLAPQTVTCAYDGAGASGAFLICLAIYAQSGQLISRTTPPIEHAAGDTGVVTFAPFLGREPEPPPPAGALLAFIVYTNDGVDDRSDIYLVDTGAGSATKITNNAALTFYDGPVLSPDGTLVAFQNNSGAMTRNLWIVNADGTGATSLVAAISDRLQWADADTILFQNSALRVRRINADGSGLGNVTPAGSINGYDCSPDGLQVAYSVNVAGVHNLRIVNTDGTGDALLVANCGALAASNAPVWRLDGSRIVFPFGAGVDSVLPDGTGQVNELAVYPTGFYFASGMTDTSLVFTDQTIFANWRLASLVFGTGYSTFAPALIVISSVFRGVGIFASGRVFTVGKNVGPGGEDSLVSVLPDGSDLTIAFNPDESGAPNFQTVLLR